MRLWRGPRCSLSVRGRRPGCGHPFGVLAVGWPRVHGALCVRAVGSITGAAAPPGAGARPAGGHALPVSGPAHAASRAAVRAARDLACPSRIA